jgi:hypothetical protein
LILLGTFAAPVALVASVLSEPFSAALSKSPKKLTQRWMVLAALAFAVVLALAACVVVWNAPLWTLGSLGGCLTLYMVWTMFRAAKDVSMNLVKHPQQRLNRSFATVKTVASMVYKFFVQSASVTKIALGELPGDSVMSLSGIVPTVLQYPLTVALFKFHTDFQFELNFIPSVSLLIAWFVVVGWIFYSVVTLVRPGWKRRFPFVREDFFDRLPLGATITDWASNTFFLTIYQKLVETLVCDPSGKTMAAYDKAECWGPTHKWIAAVSLVCLVFLVTTATTLGTQFMESKSASESSIRWSQSFQVWQQAVEMAIGTASVALSEASVIRLAIVLVCQTLLIGFIQLKSPCQHVWGVNHWTKASYCGVVVLSVYTYLNGNGWVETPWAKYSWLFVWLAIVILFAGAHCRRRRSVLPV